MIRILSFFLLIVLTSCHTWKCSPEYNQFYSHLSSKNDSQNMQESPYFLVILVNARHLDYTHTFGLLQTIAKHPCGTKTGDVGHAWIYLEGQKNGQSVYIEGGHSGELGLWQPKYFDGIMDFIDQGDPNPVRYLWTTLNDGFFQEGSGGHIPTYAVKIDLTKEQFEIILHFIQVYPFEGYSITENQCCSFVAEIAKLAQINLDYTLTLPIAKQVYFRGVQMTLWTDPQYSIITLSTPDILEKSLMELVEEGNAEYALNWYLSN